MPQLPCPPALWPEFSRLLDEAMELPPSAQPAWLAALGPEHAELLPWLRKVLLSPGTTQNSRFMQGPAAVQLTDAEFSAGQQIGPYELERPLGRGGMGEVWLAVRSDRTPNRHIALKLPHAFLLAGVHRRRFERERDILAALSHPNIAPLYDAGVADDRHPYLAMEWVDGLPIDQWCRAQALGIDARLTLFRQVLEAVGHAHAQFIAHRDLKPSNMLVTQTGQVKLLDFGIAKLLDAEQSGEATELTRAGGRAVTPDYGAPEQLAGETLTTAVDVYALGVILHELLTGRRPPPATPGSTAPLRLPSACIDERHAPRVGGLSPRALKKALSGDLDAILVKALERDPAKRYRSVEALADDLSRSRDHRPISARHIGPGALAYKFVQRHRLGVAMSAALTLALIGGSVGIAWQAIRAEREAQRATQIKDFLVSMFRASDPSVASDKPRGSITARELLDANADRIERQFAGDAPTAIELLGLTAGIYSNLNEPDRFNSIHERHLRLARAYYGTRNTVYLEALLDSAETALQLGDVVSAERQLKSIEADIKLAGQTQSPVLGRWWLIRSMLLMSIGASDSEQRHAMDMALTLLHEGAPQSRALIGALILRGYDEITRGDYEGAAEDFKRAIKQIDKYRGGIDDEAQRAYAGLAQALAYTGHADQSQAAFAQATALSLRTFGPDDWHYWEIAGSRARFLHQRGLRTEAHAVFEEALQHAAKVDNSDVNSYYTRAALVLRLLYARCLIDEDRARDAIPILEAIDRFYSELKEDNTDRARILTALGNAYLRSERFDDARQTYQHVLHILRSGGESSSADLPYVLERLATTHLAAHEDAKAQSLFAEAITDSGDTNTESLARCHAGLAELALRRRDLSGAQLQSASSMEVLHSMRGIINVRLEPALMQSRAEVLLASGDTRSALNTLRQVRTQLARYNAPDSRELLLVEQRLQEITRQLPVTTTGLVSARVAAR